MGINQVCTILSLVALFATVFLLPLILLLREDSALKTDQQQSTEDNSDKSKVTLEKSSHESIEITTQFPETTTIDSTELYRCPNKYEKPCNRSFDENNQVICLHRSTHCNKIVDCPNGEDEEYCHDTSGALNRAFKVTNQTNLQVNFSHNNCSLEEVINYICACDLGHSSRILCNNQSLTEIPSDMLVSIKTLNLDNNNISSIDSQILNQYVNLITVSLKNNQIRSIQRDAFSSLIKLRQIFLVGNKLQYIDNDAFQGLYQLKRLELQQNELITIDAGKLFRGLPLLEELYLQDNQLILTGIFSRLESINWIDLNDNYLEDIQGVFRNLDTLGVLELSNNKLTSIPVDTFQFNEKLYHLDLSLNQIHSLDVTTFYYLRNLEKLNLSHNPLSYLPKAIFGESVKLESLDLTGVEFRNIHPVHFNRTTNLKHAYFSKFRHCMYAPSVRVCRPSSDGVSSVKHLLLYPILRMSVWIVAVITCAGNSLVLVWRSMAKKEHQSLSLLVKNLAIADLMMGVYLLIIGFYDQAFREQYNNFALQWMYSWKCNFCGFLATLSSELSIFIVLMITVERYRSITMTCRLVTFRCTATILLLIWFLSLGVSLFPIIYWSQPDDPHYYASNGVCFPLHLEDPYMFGWQFSTFIFLGLNLPAVLIIMTLYTRLFLVIKRDRTLTRPALLGKAEHEDVILAFRFFCIVATDCLCWLPIVFIKTLSLLFIPISPKVYAWLVVFILPINSALNPLIYTIAAPTGFRRKLNKYVRETRRNIGQLLGFSFDRHHLREPVSSTVSSHVTGSLDHTRSSNCSVLSMVNVNSVITATVNSSNANGTIIGNSERSQNV